MAASGTKGPLERKETTMSTPIPHRLLTVVAGAALTLTGLTAFAETAHADERVCRGRLGAVTVDNLRVPDGATCTLAGTKVKGTIKVEDRAVLRASGVNVVGNVQAENHRLVVLRSSRVGGSVQLDQGGKAGVRSATITGNRVDGDIQLFENRGSQVVSKNRVGGNLQCKENRPAPTGSGNVVQGNKEDQCRRL